MVKSSGKVPYVSIILTIVNAVVFLCCMIAGDKMYSDYGLIASKVLMGRQVYRLLTAMFMHVDIRHIFSNMLILCCCGYLIEAEFGHIRYLLIYLLSGLLGNVVSVLADLFTNPNVISVGASGAIFGLDGLLLAIALFKKEKPETVTFERVGAMILLSLLSGFTGTNINNPAHIGGVLSGFVLGILCCLYDNRKGYEGEH